jgi:hypothetical protein
MSQTLNRSRNQNKEAPAMPDANGPTEAVITDAAATPAAKRELGPKVVYIQLAPGTDKNAVLSVHTNTRTLVDAMEREQGSTYVKHVLPQGEPRGPKGPKQRG